MISEKNAAGAITSRFDPNWRSWREIVAAIGWLSCASVRPIRRSFQTNSTWKIASEATAGRPSGRISRKKIRSSEAVDPRRLHQVLRNADEEVAQEEDRER